MSIPSHVDDYTHVNDFDPPDVEWMECTVAASNYRVQIAVNRHNLYRRRKKNTLEPWRQGNPI